MGLMVNKQRKGGLSEQAREARNAYNRAYYAKHPEKRKEYMRRYWEKRAQAEKNGKETA